ncbi:MAG: YdeI/OmpD-associated family protein [Chitinophagaceae bacterium]|nr:YdeI/OmpD-associated family protein [Chitinophagaceae bacterium]
MGIHPNATKEVLQYIDSMPDFSQAICKKLRNVILKTDKNIIEDWKWGPNYSYNGMLCGYGSFKHHVKFTFFNGSGMKDAKNLFNHCVDNEFSRSIKYTDVHEVDEKAITEYVKESIAVNKKGFKRIVQDKTVVVPEDLCKALAKHKQALNFFEALTYGYKKDFVEWVTTAKRNETRMDRIAKTVNMCTEGKKMNDQYK